MWAIGDPNGPMEKGTTYMVRPRIEPRNRSVSVARIAAGSRQLLVGPAASWSFEQMKVRSGTLEGLWAGLGRALGRAHVDLRPQSQAGGPARLVELEDDPLALTEHAEDGALQRVR